MKRLLPILFILASCIVLNAQTPADSAKKAVVKRWKTGFEFGVNFGAANFSNNWQGGGVSNYSLGSLLNA